MVKQKVLQVSKSLSSVIAVVLAFTSKCIANQSKLSLLCDIFSTFTVTHGGLHSLKMGCYFFGSDCFNVLGLM